jgi:hypothetical protein
LLSGRVCCRAASDSLDASAAPFEREPMHRRKQHGHGFGEACAKASKYACSMTPDTPAGTSMLLPHSLLTA